MATLDEGSYGVDQKLQNDAMRGGRRTYGKNILPRQHGSSNPTKFCTTCRRLGFYYPGTRRFLKRTALYGSLCATLLLVVRDTPTVFLLLSVAVSVLRVLLEHFWPLAEVYHLIENDTFGRIFGQFSI